MQLALAAPRPRLLLALVAALVACSSEGGHDPIGPTPVTLTGVDVTPATPWLAPGSTMRFYAAAVYSDGSRVDVTGQATWTSSEASILMVSSAPGFSGQANAVTPGSATVTAEYEGIAGSTIATVLEAGEGNLIAGTVTYDFVPATYDPASGNGTLAFGSAYAKPVRGAVVRVMQGTTELAWTTTNDAGNYQVTFVGGGTVTVTALAKTVSPPIQVEDNTDLDAIWAIGTTLAAGNATVNLHATHGWTMGVGYDDPTARTAAPFAILDSMYTAATGFVNAGRAPPYPELRVNWGPDNSTYTIGTSYYTPDEGEIYILGKAGEDTDEFDDHVIVHEWAHYFEDRLSRSDSIGGQHGLGDVLDPRLAFGEGYGTAIASILLADPIYADTMWFGPTLTAFGFSAETVPSPTDDCDYVGSSCVPGLNPGPFSELSILRALWDLWDEGGAEAWDTTSIPLGTFYDVLVGPEKTTPALTTIGSFIAGLKAQAGVDAAAVDAVLAHRGIGSITDEWGTGDADLRAMYRDVAVPSGAQAFTLDGRFYPNTQQQNRYLKFSATGSSVTVTSACAYDVDLYAFHEGTLLDFDESPDGNETIQFATTPGEVYVVVLNGWGNVNGTYSATVTISTP